MENPHAADTKDPESMDEKELKKLAKELEKKMRQAAAELNFEEAASLRDRMIEVKKMLLDMEWVQQGDLAATQTFAFGKPFMGKQPA